MEGSVIVEESASVVTTALAPSDINETSPTPERASADFRMNNGSYRKRKAKKQLGAEMTLEDLREGWTQCMYLMPQKRRLCNVGRTPGSLFCGTHRPVEEDAGNRAVKKSKFKNILLERIACPVDPSHTIYKHNLLLHTKICNVKTRLTEMKEEQFYCQDCNSGLLNPHNNANTTENSTASILPESHGIPCSNPDLLYAKIRECYRRLEISKELSFLGNTFEEHSRGVGKRGGVGAGEIGGQRGVAIKGVDDSDGASISNGGQNVKDSAVNSRNDHVESRHDSGHTDGNSTKINENLTCNDNDDNDDSNSNSNRRLGSGSEQIAFSPPPTAQCLVVKSAGTYAPLTLTAYGLLEARVVGAVSGEQVAFLRVRHAAQDAKIVWQMICHGLIEWDFEKEKNKVSHKRNDKKDEKKLFYEQNREEVEKRKREISSSGFLGNNLKRTYTSEHSTYDQSNTVFVELGAGKGLLGLAVSSVKPRSTLVLVERSGMRRKVDKCLRELDCHFYRARMDIRHCYVPNLPGVIDKEKEKEKEIDHLIDGKKEKEHEGITGAIQVNAIVGDKKNTEVECNKEVVLEEVSAIKEKKKDQKIINAVEMEMRRLLEKEVEKEGVGEVEKKVVIMAKHLCGVATDLALRSLEAFKTPILDQIDPSSVPLSTPGLVPKANGVAIATCCHHACVWEDYTGIKWFTDQGFDAQDFELMRHWSGWAHTLRTKESRRRQVSTSKKSGDSKEEEMGNAQGDGSAVRDRQIGNDEAGFVKSIGNGDDKGREGSGEGRRSPVDAHDGNEGGEELPQVVSTVTVVAEKSSNVAELDEEQSRDIVGVEEDCEGHPDKEEEIKEEENEEEEEEEEEVEHALSKGVTTAVRPANISYDDMSCVGKMVKRILDQGRVEYLRSLDLHANQIQYCHYSLSPECVMIIATRQ